jgi:hypothetical protein
MNTIELAQAKYQLVTKLDECPFQDFWVVLLDDATEIYDSHYLPDNKEPNAWMRLKMLCQESGRKVVNMAYLSKNQQGGRIDCEPMQDGYFFSKKITKLMAADPSLGGYAEEAIGIGYLKGELLKITWRSKDGNINYETRHIDKSKQLPFNLITANA